MTTGLMPKAGLVLASSLVLLGGCGVDDWVGRMNAQRFHKACVGLGIPTGTPEFSNCMVQQSAQNAAENQRIQDRAALDNAARKIKK